MLSAQSQDKRTAIACNQLFRLADTPQDMIKLTREEVIEQSDQQDCIMRSLRIYLQQAKCF